MLFKINETPLHLCVSTCLSFFSHEKNLIFVITHLFISGIPNLYFKADVKQGVPICLVIHLKDGTHPTKINREALVISMNIREETPF
jgi:hypothetical protein